jgi:hypothetical protein
VAASVHLPAGPFAVGLSRTNIERPGVLRIADLPVIALAMAGVEIMAAHRLGLPAETLRQIGSVETGHHAASRSPMRWTG